MPNREELAQEYLARGYWQGVTVSQALDRAVASFPDNIALVHGNQRVTYRELGVRAERLARAFLRRGLHKGDIVTVQLPNTPDYVYVHYALAKIGVITLPTIPLFRRKEMGHILGFSRSVGYVIPAAYGGFNYLEMMEEMRPDLPHLRHVFVAGDGAPDGTDSIQAMINEDNSGTTLPSEEPDTHLETAALVITGGTTGFSKGVPRSHNQLLCHARSWSTIMEVTSESTFLVLVPLTHVFGLVEGLYAPLTSGATLVMIDRFETLDALRLIQQERVSQALLVPALIVSLIHSHHLKDFDTASLRMIITGGGQCPEEVIQQAKALLGCNIISQYGMSEGPVSTTVLGDPPEVVSVTVGTPNCGGSEFKIVDDERRPVEPGESGELAFRGPTLFDGYFENPEETAAAFDDEGWFYTGDLCVQDARGDLRIVGRKKDIIKRGGETVMPREIEELLYTHPNVINAAVVGMPDLRLGERVCAYIVPKAGTLINLAEVARFLRQKGLAGFKLPERIEVVSELPITPPSKVQKNVLREDIARKLAGESK